MSEHGAVRSGNLVAELEALAALLAEVVALADKRAIFPARWAAIAEMAMGHDSVRRAVVAAEDDCGRYDGMRARSAAPTRPAPGPSSAMRTSASGR